MKKQLRLQQAKFDYRKNSMVIHFEKIVLNINIAPSNMNKVFDEPLVIEDEPIDENISQANIDMSLGFEGDQKSKNIERSADKELADIQDKVTSGRQCPICLKKFIRQDYFIHIRQSHLEIYTHQCKFCKFMCQDRNQLSHHMKKKHKEKDIEANSFINNNSDKANTENDILSDEENDLRENKRMNERNNGKNTYNCPLCFCKLKTLPNLKKHIMQHSNKRLECIFCKFKTIFKGQMSSHYYQEHPSQKIQWKEVFLDVGGPNNLVEDVEPYLLQVKVKYGFIKPNKTSNFQRQYQCPHCDYMCNFNSSFNRHLRIHGGKKDFKCGYCDFHAREAYVIHKHSKKMHINQEVKIEKDIGYNVPYRYSNQAKNRSKNKAEIISKLNNDLGSCTNTTLRNDQIIEKHDFFISNKGSVSNPVISETGNVSDQLIISRDKVMSDYGNGKTWDHSYYDKMGEVKDSIIHRRGAKESQEVNILSLKKRSEYIIRKRLDDNFINNMYKKQIKIVKSRYESEKTSNDPEFKLIEVSEEVCKSKHKVDTDARSLTVKNTPLINGSQGVNVAGQNLNKVDDMELDLLDNTKENFNKNQFVQTLNNFISDLPSIVLCKDNDFEDENDAVLILSVDQEVNGNNFKPDISIKDSDNIKDINQTLSVNSESFTRTLNKDSDSFISEVKRQEGPQMTEFEMFCTNEKFENFKNSEINKNNKEFDVSKNGSEKELSNKSQIPPKLSNFPHVPERMNQTIGLDHQNKEYFNPDKIRSMMKISGNGRLECTICGVTTTKRAFYKHAKKHFNIKPFKCGHCEYQAIEKSMIRGHNSRCHTGSHCVIIKLSPKRASQHSQDSEMLMPKRDKCSDLLSFENKMAVNNTDNIKKQNSEEMLNPGSRSWKNKSISSSSQCRLFTCPECQKELRFHQPTVRRHLYIHYDYKPFKCGLCHFTASTVGEIRGHHVTHRTTEEARIESSGAVMNPNLTKLLEDIFGYNHTIT